MFVLVRYFGLSWAILDGGLAGTTFVPGPVKMCTAIYLVANWTFHIFLAAADLVMILRVYTMWNHSKWILYILLFVYVPQIITSTVAQGIYANPNTYLLVTVVQVTIDVAVCNFSSNPSNVDTSKSYQLTWGITALRLVLAIMLLILAVIPSLKQSVAMYKATKQWQPNHYLQLFAKDGILYFLASLIFNIITFWLQYAVTFNSTLLLVLVTLSYTTLCPIMPRFIISVRELYDRDLRGRWQGIDTGFGVASKSISSENAAVSAIQFADAAPRQEEGQVAEGAIDDSEAIRLETRAVGDSTRQV